jgi:hypothetical protein
MSWLFPAELLLIRCFLVNGLIIPGRVTIHPVDSSPISWQKPLFPILTRAAISAVI